MNFLKTRLPISGHASEVVKAMKHIEELIRKFLLPCAKLFSNELLKQFTILLTTFIENKTLLLRR